MARRPTLATFELFVAHRYLRARRREAAISLITAISVLGVTAGVMALIIALAINAGFRNTLQRNLLGATAHVSVLEKEPSAGIAQWQAIGRQLSQVPHVRNVGPTLYGEVFLVAANLSRGAVLKGIEVTENPPLPALRRLQQGNLQDLVRSPERAIVLGARLAESLGVRTGDHIELLQPRGTLTPLGLSYSPFRFKVAGLFESGFFELDSAWAYTSLRTAQAVLGTGDVVNSIELHLDDPDQASSVVPEVQRLIGRQLGATSWMEQNRQLLGALKMERAVTTITIGLIQLVGALNILIALTMIVMEKRKDIAILVAMGARPEQIRTIFVLQGLLIGVAGTLLGAAIGYTVCVLANRYQWVQLDAQIYALSYVPFEPRLLDGLWIVAVAIGVSVAATLWPARNATRVRPVEVLRYE